MSEIELLALHRATAFVFDASGRMTHEAAPDRSRGRRFSFTGCSEGNLGVVRDDVSDELAGELELLLGDEPPLAAPDAVPVHADAYRRALASDDLLPEASLGLLWVFPGPLSFPTSSVLVWSGTDEGDRVLDGFGALVSPSLRQRGFRSSEDLWAPWCVAMVEGKVVSIAETVRSSAAGAEVGVDTAAEFTGRGLGAATTAGWSRHPDLADRTLFYSTSRDNLSSRRLTQRLGLRFVGSSFAVA